MLISNALVLYQNLTNMQSKYIIKKVQLYKQIYNT